MTTDARDADVVREDARDFLLLLDDYLREIPDASAAERDLIAESKRVTGNLVARVEELERELVYAQAGEGEASIRVATLEAALREIANFTFDVMDTDAYQSGKMKEIAREALEGSHDR